MLIYNSFVMHNCSVSVQASRGKRGQRYTLKRGTLYIYAGVVQWQNTSLPSWIRGFDSHHPLTANYPLAGKEPFEYVAGFQPDCPLLFRADKRIPAGLSTDESAMHQSEQPCRIIARRSRNMCSQLSWIEQRPSKPWVGGSNPFEHVVVMIILIIHMVGIAQLVSAPDCGSGGQGFESLYPPSWAIAKR